MSSTSLEIDFWNGNRSAARQAYELAILDAILKETATDYGPKKIIENLADYDGPTESRAFSEKRHDLLVTVAGNLKFKGVNKIEVKLPIAKNLLGYRVLITRREDEELFSKIKNFDQLKNYTIGIPETWSDADVFRHNNLDVYEKGSFEDLFERLAQKEFDYCSFGVNEVLKVFESRVSSNLDLVINQNILLFYPFPLVFYVHPEQKELATQIENGLQKIIQFGVLDRIYAEHFGQLKRKLNLSKRNSIELQNPLISAEYASISSAVDNL